MTQPPDHPQHDSAEEAEPGRAQPPYVPDAGPPDVPTIAPARHHDVGGRSTRRRRVGMISGGGALLVVAIAVVAAVVASRPGRSDGTEHVADSSVTSTAPAPSRTTDAKSHKPSASARPSHDAPRRSEPPAHRPPAQLGDKVDWSPFEHAYGAATEPPSGSRSARGGVTDVRASRSFGAYQPKGLASVTADARYFATASQARRQYDEVCGGSSGKESGSTRSADAGDRACSYVSDVSDGSSGTVILYVQVLRGNVLLQVAPEAFHDGRWTGSDLAALRSTSVRCASATAARL